MKDIPKYSPQEIDAVIPDGGIDPRVKVAWRPTEYTLSNDTTDRTLDADSTTTAELSDIICTLLRDLADKGIIKIS